MKVKELIATLTDLVIALRGRRTLWLEFKSRTGRLSDD
jgi:hypothetical protein